MKKQIISETKNYEQSTVDELLLDDTPKVNSFNFVTSDGVARAISGASGEVPVVTEGDNGKVLKAIYDEGGPAVEWGEATVDQTYDATSTNAQSGVAVAQAIAAIPSSSSYTAGDGITISAQNEVSAVGGTGITVTQASQSTGTLTSTVNSWSQIETLAPLTSTLMGLIDNGLTITLTADVAPYIISYQPTQVYLVIFSNYANYAVLSQLQGATFSEVDSAWFVSNMPSQITFDSGDYNSSLSTISLDTIRANPSNHYLSFLFVTSNGNRLASAVGFNGAWSQGTSITTGSYSVTVPGKITVTNPVPSYNTSADNGKVLSVGSNGLEWDTPQSGSTYTAGEGIDITSDVISVDHDSTLTTNSVSGSLSATVGQWSDLPYVGELTGTLAGYMDSDGLPVTLTNGKFPSIHRYPVALYLALYKDASHYVVLSQIPGVTFLYDGEYAYTAQGVPNQVTYSGADYNSAKSTDTWSDVLASPTSYKISYIFDCSTYGYLIANNVGFDSSWTSGQTVTTGTYNVSSNKITVTNPVPAYAAGDAGKVLKVNAGGTAVEWGTAGGGGSSSSAFDTTFNLVNDGAIWRLSNSSSYYINLTGGAGVYAYRVVAEITDSSNPTVIDDIYRVTVRIGNSSASETKTVYLKSNTDDYPEDPASISYNASGILNISSDQHIRGQNVYVRVVPAKGASGTAVSTFTGGSVTLYLAKLSTLSGGWQPES